MTSCLEKNVLSGRNLIQNKVNSKGKNLLLEEQILSFRFDQLLKKDAKIIMVELLPLKMHYLIWTV